MRNTSVEELSKQVTILKRYCICVTILLFAMISVCYFIGSSNNKELTVERINIVEADGTLRMVISNRARQHPGRMDNKDLPERDRPAGLLFFNDEGDECGGLGYNGNKKEAAMFMTMDQYKNDQIMTISYDQENSSGKPARSYGFTLNDRDELPLSGQISYFDSLKKLKDTSAYAQGLRRFKAEGHLAQRMFLGKNKSGEVGLFLTDTKGRPRLRIFIDKKNEPIFQALDENGNVKEK
ncbi:hypothetical protein SAMN05421856_102412 [Chryseobacterium taichungense]|uniref:Uncharacterized protein n=1 Tax=Chryseobacterium taichungense TaxID=295069 RepID=A0A1H7XFU7_9FLAO|nr:hypothetical protein [Chryseobacterium taichungense]SEM32543.1 hypothetical protein SAMN05421856_102412 [Chryseobacterium taichungense]